MENFKPSPKKDKEILTHIRWASRQICKLTTKHDQFQNLYFDELGDAISEALRPGDERAHKFMGLSRTLADFNKHSIKSFINLPITVERHRDGEPGFYTEKHSSNEGAIDELEDYSGILYQMSFENEYYCLLIQKRDEFFKYSKHIPDKAKPGKKIRPDGWRIREWDGIPRILYHLNDPHPHKPIDLLLQISIDLIQRGFLTGPDCILKDFRKYISERLALKHKTPTLAPAIDQQMSEKERKTSIKLLSRLEEEGLSEELEHKVSADKINLRKINENVLKESLNHIVKRTSFLFFYSPNTFKIYVKKVIKGKIRDYNRQVTGIPKKKYRYYKPKPNPERKMKQEIIDFMCDGWAIKRVINQSGFCELEKKDTGKKIGKKAARRKLNRWLKEWDLDLDTIMLELF